MQEYQLRENKVINLWVFFSFSAQLRVHPMTILQEVFQDILPNLVCLVKLKYILICRLSLSGKMKKQQQQFEMFTFPHRKR